MGFKSKICFSILTLIIVVVLSIFIFSVCQKNMANLNVMVHGPKEAKVTIVGEGRKETQIANLAQFKNISKGEYNLEVVADSYQKTVKDISTNESKLIIVELEKQNSKKIETKEFLMDSFHDSSFTIIREQYNLDSFITGSTLCIGWR